MSRLHRHSRAEADREIKPLYQTEFDGGMNLDVPASALEKNELSFVQNYICYKNYMEARPGSMLYSNFTRNEGTPAQSVPVGTLHSIGFQKGGLWAFHSGAKLSSYSDPPEYVYADNDATNGDSNMVPFLDYWALFTTGGIWYSASPVGSFRLNAPNPVSGVPSVFGVSPYVYRYLVTLSRITDKDNEQLEVANRIAEDAEITHESGSNSKNEYISPVTARDTDYGEVIKGGAIAPGSGHTISNDALKSFFGSFAGHGDDSAASHFTHVSIYRTLDLGQDGIDPITGAGNNSEIYGWIGDVLRSDLAITPGFTFEDDISDDILRDRILSGGFTLNSRNMQPLPSGDIGCVTSNYMFSAVRNTKRLYYSDISRPELAGYYYPDIQLKDFNDGITALASTQDILSIFCTNSTQICSLTAFEVLPFNTITASVLTHFTSADDSIGVVDYGSISKKDKNTLIALCTDFSVRFWNFSQWSEPVSKDKVTSELSTIRPTKSVGVYIGGAYYLWYSNSLADSATTKCLRYGFGGLAGSGWSFMTGDWPFPPFKTGAVVITDAAHSLQRLIVQDATTKYLYWVDTYDPYSGAFDQHWLYQILMARQETDRAEWPGASLAGLATPAVDSAIVQDGTEIACSFKSREVTGSDEAFRLLHQETHLFMRPRQESQGYRDGLEIDISAYGDGNTVAAETMLNIPKTGDITFTKEISGRRLQVGVTTNKGQHRITGISMRCRVLDKSNYKTAASSTDSENTTNASHYQLYLATSLKHWLTRSSGLKNFATGSNYTLAGTAPTLVTGPDGNDYGLNFVSGASYQQADTTVYDNVSALFWVKEPTLNSEFFQIDGTSDLSIQFTTNTNIRIVGADTVNVTCTTVASGWHHFLLVRESGTLYVYQNGALIGSGAMSGTYGGTRVWINSGASPVSLFDVRLYNDNLSSKAEVAAYYYSDVINNSGNNVLPTV